MRKLWKKFWEKYGRSISLNLYLLITLTCVAGMAVSVSAIVLSFHNIDLSMNMLIVAKEFNLDWWKMEDVYGTYIQGSETEYFSMPYPALYIQSIKMLLWGCALLAISTFGTAWGLSDIVGLKEAKRK